MQQPPKRYPPPELVISAYKQHLEHLGREIVLVFNYRDGRWRYAISGLESTAPGCFDVRHYVIHNTCLFALNEQGFPTTLLA